MNHVCYVPQCQEPNKNLWSVSNTEDAPLKYVPFHVCHKHLEQNSQMEDAFLVLCHARLTREEDDRIECAGYIFEKKVHTWKKVSKHECNVCERTDKLWVKVTRDFDEDRYPDTKFEYICDVHIPRNKSICLGKDYYPLEDTW
jgi:hypothetical protein